VGSWVPKETFIWQDPIPAADGYTLKPAQINKLKSMLADAGLDVSQMIKTAWAAASSYRRTDHRGGANGARIALDPQKEWEINEPKKLEKVLKAYRAVKKDAKAAGIVVSLADLIVLGGAVGIEQAAKKAGARLTVPFKPGRMDTTQAKTDTHSFSVLEPKYDAFRNYQKKEYSATPEELLVDKADRLGLTAPEMTVLIGGLRVLGNNYQDSPRGVFTTTPHALTNDFFINVLDMGIEWKPTKDFNLFEGIDRDTGKRVWTASRADLIFGSSSDLRALAEVYASDGADAKFREDFVKAWNKVMDADRFDLDPGKKN
jgi:catalase-peroxidase